MNRHALLVGINVYEAAELNHPRPLRYAENDAKDLAHFLSDTCGYATTVLLGQAAVNDAIVKTMERGLGTGSGKGIAAEDQFLFFFAGHGQLLVPGNRFVIHPFDAVPSSESRSLTVERIVDIVATKVPDGQCMLILDACRNLVSSGDARGAGGVFDEAASRDIGAAVSRYRDRDLRVLSACKEGERSYEDEGFEHGVLTHFLLESLKTCAARGEVTFSALEEETGEKMKCWVHPKLNTTQRPRAYGDVARIVLMSADAAARYWATVDEEERREFLELKRREAARVAQMEARARKREAQRARIAELKQRLGKGLSSSPQLDDVVSAALEEEKAKEQLLALERSRAEELHRLREEDRRARSREFAADVSKYQRVASTRHARRRATDVWNALLQKHGAEHGAIAEGDVDALMETLGLRGLPSKVRLSDGKTAEVFNTLAVRVVVDKMVRRWGRVGTVGCFLAILASLSTLGGGVIGAWIGAVTREDRPADPAPHPGGEAQRYDDPSSGAWNGSGGRGDAQWLDGVLDSVLGGFLIGLSLAGVLSFGWGLGHGEKKRVQIVADVLAHYPEGTPEIAYAQQILEETRAVDRAAGELGDALARALKPATECFIGTAVASSLGWEYDCRELEILRHLRDTYMQRTLARRLEVERYYDIAPGIVSRVNSHPDAGAIWTDVARRHVLPVVRAAERGDAAEAHSRYRAMVEELSARWLTDDKGETAIGNEASEGATAASMRDWGKG